MSELQTEVLYYQFRVVSDTRPFIVRKSVTHGLIVRSPLAVLHLAVEVKG